MVDLRIAAAVTVVGLALSLGACGGGSSGGSGGTGGTTGAGGGAPAGQVACDATGDTRVPCPGHATIALDTAVPTLKLGQTIAEGTFGAGKATWTTGIQGLGITRAGKIAGTGLSGWVFGFCNGLDQFGIDTTNGNCSVELTCNVLDCSKVPTHAFPKVDSDAAIKAAFPNEGADATYSILLNYLGGTNYWSVTSLQAQTTVHVDSDTGMVVP